MLTWATTFLHSALAFIIILVPLVVFHEFGHYVFAKIFGVKAEIFSVGFGPRLWAKQLGETELRVSAIPMGGYVKLLGEDREAELSPAEQSRALHRQKPWKRFFIFFGGPLFNFILAIFIFMAIFMIGEPQIANVAGRVVQGSQAERAGFQSGDRILSVNGKPVKKYEDVILALNESPKAVLSFEVVHPRQEKPVTLSVETSSQSGFSIYGESTRVGEIDGLFPIPRSTDLGVSNPASLAGQAGLKTGDKITHINGKAVSTWEEIEDQFQTTPIGSFFEIKFTDSKAKEPRVTSLKKVAAAQSLGDAFGLYSSELFVEKAVAKSPAENAGLRAGDRLVGVGPRVVHSFFELKDSVQKSGEKDGKVLLNWERDGKVHSVEIIPTATDGRDPVLNKTTQFTVGVIPMLVMAEPVTLVERTWNPFTLFYKASERMVSLTWRNLVSLRKMITGDVSVGTLGGPIMIGKIAGESLTRGLIAFLTNMAIFSIGLGVLNILPVPVLDGGHLLLLGVEAIRGRPLTLRQMEVVQGFGLVLILALMGIAFSNDIARLFYS
jgi:regulator of sigma E protease